MNWNVTWDDAKDRANRIRHGIPFQEASILFTSGADYLEIFDAEHSLEEERFIAIGPIPKGLVLVAWTERDDGSIRLISARWATPGEKTMYYSYMDTRS